MRVPILFVVAIALAQTAPALAQSGDEMELQRCVWACLARSSGNEDPAYHACVENVCLAKKPRDREKSQSVVPRVERPDRSTVGFVQRRLAELGFEPGPVDGIYGQKTRAAVRAFRRSRGLDEAGGIDENLLTILRATGKDTSGGQGGLPEARGKTGPDDDLPNQLSCASRPAEVDFSRPNVVPPTSVEAEGSSVFYSHDSDIIRIDPGSIANNHFAGAGDDLIYVDGPKVATQVLAENGGDTVLLCAIGEVTTTVVLGPYDLAADTVFIDTSVFAESPGEAARIAIHEFNPVTDRVVIRVPEGSDVSFGTSLFRTVLPIRIGRVRIELYPALVAGRIDDAIHEAVSIATADGGRIPLPDLGFSPPETIEGEMRVTARAVTLAGGGSGDLAGFRSCPAPDAISDPATPRPMYAWDKDRGLEYSGQDDVVVHRNRPSTGLVHTGAGDDLIYIYEAISGLMFDGEAGADTFVLCTPAPDGLSLTLGLGSWAGPDIDADTVIVAPAMFEAVAPGHRRKFSFHSFNPVNDRLILRLPENASVSYGDQQNGAVLIRAGAADISLHRSDDWLSTPFDWDSVILVGEDHVPAEAARTVQPGPAQPVDWRLGEPRTYGGHPAEPVQLDPDCAEMRDPQAGLSLSSSLERRTGKAAERPIPEDEEWLYFSHDDDLIRIGRDETTEAVNVHAGRGDDAIYMFDVGDGLTVFADAGADTLVVCSMLGVSLGLSLPLDRFADRIVIEPAVFLNVPPGIPRTILINGFASVNDRLELRVPASLQIEGVNMQGGGGVSFQAGGVTIVVHDAFPEVGTLVLQSQAISVVTADPR